MLSYTMKSRCIEVQMAAVWYRMVQHTTASRLAPLTAQPTAQYQSIHYTISAVQNQLGVEYINKFYANCRTFTIVERRGNGDLGHFQQYSNRQQDEQYNERNRQGGEGCLLTQSSRRGGILFVNTIVKEGRDVC